MNKHFQILQAINSERNSVYIDDVPNGKRCNCTCKECEGKLIARNNGKVRTHHFAHENGNDSIKCSQTALHLLAKEIISETKMIPIIRNGRIAFAEVPFVEQEKNLGNITPDLYAEHNRKPIIIEIYVSHAVDEAKLNKIKAHKLTAFEINLSQINCETKDEVEKAIYDIQNIRILYDGGLAAKHEKKELSGKSSAYQMEAEPNRTDDTLYQLTKPDDDLEDCKTSEPAEVESETPQYDDIENEYHPIDEMTLESIELKKSFLTDHGKKLLLIGYGDAPQCPHPLATREGQNGGEPCIKNYCIPLHLCKKCVHCFYPGQHHVYCGYKLRTDTQYDTFTLIHQRRKLSKEDFPDYISNWEQSLDNEISNNKNLTKFLFPLAKNHATISQQEFIFMERRCSLKGLLGIPALCLAVLAVMTLSACVSAKPDEQPMPSHSSVVQVPEATKDELWLRANEWCIDAFKNSTNVIQYSDKEAGVIRGKFTGEYNGYYYEYVQTTFSVEVKDGKARLTFYDPLRVVLGDIMFGGYSSPKEVPVYESDEKLTQSVYSDWMLLEASFSNILKQRASDDW